MVLFDVNVK